MPQIGWFEILIIVAIAIIVIGPKDFPFMLKKIGSWIGSVKKYVGDVQEELSVLNKETFETDVKNNNTDTKKKDKNDQGTK
tara:strand:+ start:6627 stop:6869 length:243 start_codon:yes stop_codon:yes gene_type:complete